MGMVGPQILDESPAVASPFHHQSKSWKNVKIESVIDAVRPGSRRNMSSPSMAVGFDTVQGHGVGKMSSR